MKVTSLSNHPEQQRTLVQQKHAASRSGWNFWRRSYIPAVGQEERRLDAGIAGEENVADALTVLSDEWHLFRGYRNRRGEIDHVLVGPGGIWAIEVKNTRATVYVDGDYWAFERFDNYGNLVEEGELADRGGRSWSRQVNEPARELSKFLTKRNAYSTISSAVVLTNRRAKLGQCDALTVDVLSVGTDYLLNKISGVHGQQLSREQVQTVAALVQRDHTFHSQRRR